MIHNVDRSTIKLIVDDLIKMEGDGNFLDIS